MDKKVTRYLIDRDLNEIFLIVAYLTNNEVHN